NPSARTHRFHLFYSIIRPPTTSTLLPYTTLFRSSRRHGVRSAIEDRPDDRDAVPGGVERRVQADGGRRGPHGPDVRHLHHPDRADRKSTRLNSSHEWISYVVFGVKNT